MTDRMDSEEADAAVSWRVVVFTVLPPFVYQYIDRVLAERGHRIVGVVTTPGPKARRSTAHLDVVAAIRPGVDVLVSNHPERWAGIIALWKPDLIVCAGMPWRIPPEVLAIPRLGAINHHDALLPRGRGPNATGWAFRNDDGVSGITIHRLAAEFDTWPILAQARVPIDDDDDSDAVMARYGAVMPDLLRAALDRVARGDEGEPQDESLATEAGLFEEEWRYIDWEQPSRTIHNQVRSWIALRDLPRGAIGVVGGNALRITRTSLLSAAPEAQRVAPGTVLERTDDRMVVQCGDGPLELVSWSDASEQ